MHKVCDLNDTNIHPCSACQSQVLAISKYMTSIQMLNFMQSSCKVDNFLTTLVMKHVATTVLYHTTIKNTLTVKLTTYLYEITIVLLGWFLSQQDRALQF